TSACPRPGGSPIVPRSGHPDDLHVRGDAGDGGQEAVVEERIGQQVRRCVVGGEDEGDAAGEESVEQAGGEHGGADVVEVELVEADQAGVAGQRGDGVVDGGGGRGGGVQGGEEFVEMPAARAIGAGGGEEAVHEHGLASARRAVQVDAAGAPAGSATAIQE